MVVLGDPGSGKTTLLRYLALCYARDRAEGSAVVRDNLSLPESGHLPILLPLRNLGAFLKEHYLRDDGTEGHARLLEFLAQYLENERIILPGDFFDGALSEGHVVVLMDGMDEVGDPALRRRVALLIDAFAAACPKCRIVVTSRIVGYTGSARLGEGFVTTTVRDFTLADVELFLRHWHRLVAVGQMGPGESAEAFAAGQTGKLMEAIKANARVRELATNPLMLTVIALVHRDRVKLPDRRAELYAEAVDVLLGKWDEARGVEEVGILDDRPLDAGDRRLLLQSIALQMHDAHKKEIEEEDLHRQLLVSFTNMTPDVRAAQHAVRRFLSVIQERTGLLVEAGPGLYRFSHLTFQEYLSALAILARDDYIDYTLKRAPDPWWREAILLEVGQLSTKSREQTTQIIQRIAELRPEPAPYHNLVLAVEALRDAGITRVDGRVAAEIQRRVKSKLEQDRPVWSKLLGKLTVRAWVEERGRVVEALVQSGAGYWTLPNGEPEWIKIPAGEFWMGEGREIHHVFVPEFQIARVPITNAQYHLFVQAAHAKPPEHWMDGSPPRGKASHPVANVSWHDAIAYCKWLSQVTGKAIRLPTEAEWEKAARGDKDQRGYPWGNDFDSSKCNSEELGLGDTSPVGVFPTGVSPYGCLDMAGNVREWCQSSHKPYPYETDDGRESREGNQTRVVRGGSFGSSRGGARCAGRGVDLRPVYRGYGIGFRVVVSPASRF
jgi:formylglycine-generating enzyme required for sulfatase activity